MARTKAKETVDIAAICKERGYGMRARSALCELSDLVGNDKAILSNTMALVQRYRGRLNPSFTNSEDRECLMDFSRGLLSVAECTINSEEINDKKGKTTFLRFVKVLYQCDATAIDLVVSGFGEVGRRVIEPYENHATARFALEAMTKVFEDYPSARGPEAKRATNMLTYMARRLQSPELVMEVARTIGLDLHRSYLRKHKAH